MSWEAAGAVGEIVAAAGVIVSLIFLSMQLRGNTRSIRASSSFDAQCMLAEVTESVTKNELYFSVAQKIWAQDLSLQDLSDEDRAAFSIFCRGLYMRAQAMYFLNQQRQVDDELWAGAIGVLRGNFHYRAYREWWETEKQSGLMLQGFIEAMELAPGVKDDPFRVHTGNTPA